MTKGWGLTLAITADWNSCCSKAASYPHTHTIGSGKIGEEKWGRGCSFNLRVWSYLGWKYRFFNYLIHPFTQSCTPCEQVPLVCEFDGQVNYRPLARLGFELPQAPISDA